MVNAVGVLPLDFRREYTHSVSPLSWRPVRGSGTRPATTTCTRSKLSAVLRLVELVDLATTGTP